MGILKIYDSNISRDSIAADRDAIYLNRSAEQKIYALLNLIHTAVQMNNGYPLKKPQGKGIIIRKS